MQDFLTTTRLVIVSMAVCCVGYPAVLLIFGQLVVPWRADGSMIRNEQGVIIGSELIAQGFTEPGYFWPRPSGGDYGTLASTGTNLSPLHPQLRERAVTLVDQFDPAPGREVPSDLVTISGSGLDPHITLDAALFQLPRVAAARGMDEAKVRELVMAHLDSPTINLLGGEPLVNVLMLNIALDRVSESLTVAVPE